MIDPRPTAGWYPRRLLPEASPPTLEWMHLGDMRFMEAFFDQSFYLRKVTEKRHTGLQELHQLAGELEQVPLRGMIFHMSRCGSTLLSQWLSLMPSSIMISESPALDALLRLHLSHPGVNADSQRQWIRSLVAVLGQKRHPEEERLFLKLDCWHIWLAPLLQAVFPDVPRIFLLRAPGKVMRSHQRTRGTLSVPGLVEASLSGIDRQGLSDGDLDGYLDRMLARWLRALQQVADPKKDVVLHYESGNRLLLQEMLSHFGLSPSPEEMEAMAARSATHSKRPQEGFVEPESAIPPHPHAAAEYSSALQCFPVAIGQNTP